MNTTAQSFINGELLATTSSSNCQVFLLFSNWGVPVEFDCQPGTHWSIASDRCEYPEVANCTLEGSSTASTTSTLSTLTTTIFEITLLPSECPLENDPITNPIYLPHESDCSLFYLCYHGEKILYQCSSPPFLYWSIEFNRCETAVVANCLLGQTTTDEVTIPWDPRCPLIDDADNPASFPDEDDCELFWQCDAGEMILSRCSDRNHWRFVLFVIIGLLTRMRISKFSSAILFK